jgi:hypothetical protein
MLAVITKYQLKVAGDNSYIQMRQRTPPFRAFDPARYVQASAKQEMQRFV